MFADKPDVIALVYPSDEVREGSDISLQCKADANPEVNKYTWKKHDRVITNVSVYNITKIDRSQAGEYTCSRYNKLGDSSHNFNIPVLCKYNNLTYCSYVFDGTQIYD